jgi:hypothetical protein
MFYGKIQNLTFILLLFPVLEKIINIYVGKLNAIVIGLN